MHRRPMKIISFLMSISLLLGANPAPAAALQDPAPNPSLLKDVNPALTDGSSPSYFMPSGPVSYFFASRGGENPALWKTDGTAAGTVLVKAGIRPGGDSFADYHGFLYFPASTPEAGNELWRTDGTPAGTELFADIAQGYYGSDPSYLTMFEDRLYFGADWNRFCISDGTPAGTIRSGGLAIESPMLEFKGSLYYSAYVPDYIGNNDQRYLAWFGSGGSGQTTDLDPGRPLIVYKDRLYFTASRPDVGQELWSTGGTLESISLLKNINPTGDSMVRDPVEFNGLLYFVAEDVDYHPRLWRTDGSESGTVPVFGPSGVMTRIDIIGALQPGGAGLQGSLLLALSEASGSTEELWSSDGTPTGNQKLADIRSGGAIFNNAYYFGGYDALHGAELWRTDGTPAGTGRLAELWPGPRGSNPSTFALCETRLCFSADDGAHGVELWSSDGTAQGTGMVVDLNTRPSNSNPNHFARAENLVYFFASDATSGSNLWRTDGTPQGTLALNLDSTVKMVPDLSPGLAGWYDYDPRSAVLGDTLFFPASDPAHGTELWKSDGTPAGTGLVKDIWPGPESSSPRLMRAAGDHLFFFASTPGAGEELWVSDGTPGGTMQVAELVPNETGNYLSTMVVFGTAVIFSIQRSDTSTCELWRSDGSSQGTWRISQDLCLGYGERTSAVFQGKLYFSGNQKNNWTMLWESDGTAGGTHPVPRDSYNDSPFNLDRFTVTPAGLYMILNYFDGYYLFRLPVGGSSAERVYNFYNINGINAIINEVVSFGQQVALIVSGAASEAEGWVDQLWLSDGSEAGTRRIEGDFSQPANVMSSGGRLYFTATDVSGTQLWRTDGTDAGTARASSYAQSRCMPWSSDQSVAELSPNAFVLALNDETSNPPGTGCELWLYDTLPQKMFLPAIHH